VSDRAVGINAEVYLSDLSYELSRALSQRELREFILLLDAEVAEKSFTAGLVESLGELLEEEYDIKVTINEPEEEV